MQAQCPTVVLRATCDEQPCCKTQVAGAGVQLATEVQGLLALPAATAANAPALMYAYPPGNAYDSSCNALYLSNWQSRVVIAKGLLQDALAVGSARCLGTLEGASSDLAEQAHGCGRRLWRTIHSLHYELGSKHDCGSAGTRPRRGGCGRRWRAATRTTRSCS